MRRAVLALAVGAALLAPAACGAEKSPSAGGPTGVTTTGPSLGGPTRATVPSPGGPTKVTATGPSVGGPTRVTGTVSPQIKALCEALGRVYSKDLGPFAEALTTMVADRTSPSAKASRQQAQAKLSTLATDIRAASESSTDPQLRADGLRAAEQVRAKAADDTFFSAIQTTKDIGTTLGPTLKQWLAPAAQHC